MPKIERIKTVWEVWTYDVWGNARDGYDVNDRCCIDRECELALTVETHNAGTEREFKSAFPSDKQIRRAFGVRCRIETDGDAENIYVHRERDRYPIGELFLVKPSQLSPIKTEATEETPTL